MKPSYLYEVVAKHGFIQVTLGPKPSLAHFSLHNVQNMGRGVFCLGNSYSGEGEIVCLRNYRCVSGEL